MDIYIYCWSRGMRTTYYSVKVKWHKAYQTVLQIFWENRTTKEPFEIYQFPVKTQRKDETVQTFTTYLRLMS